MSILLQIEIRPSDLQIENTINGSNEKFSK